MSVEKGKKGFQRKRDLKFEITKQPTTTKQAYRNITNLSYDLMEYIQNPYNRREALDRNSSFRLDFQKYYKPSDNMYGSGTGVDDRPSFADLRQLANERVGFGHKLITIAAQHAMRNDVIFEKIATHVEKKMPQFQEWAYKIDMWNMEELAVQFDRTYGMGSLLFYWGKMTSLKDLEKKPPNTPPTSVQAFTPDQLTPNNLFDTGGKLDYDPEQWSLSGGGSIGHVSQVHPDRVFPIITRHKPDDWLGYSVFDNIYLEAMAYYQVVINVVRGIARWGTSIPIFTMQDETPIEDKFNDYKALVEDFRANSIFIVAQGDSLEFVNPEPLQGVGEMIDFLKQGIASGSGYSMNWLWGTAESGGIGDGGALTSERGDIQNTSNIQYDVQSIEKNMFGKWFDFTGYKITRKLEYAMTEEMKLMLKMQEVQLKILEEQGKQVKLQTQMLQDQMDKGMHLMTEEVSNAGEDSDIDTGDFIMTPEKRRLVMNFVNNFKIKNR